MFDISIYFQTLKASKSDQGDFEDENEGREEEEAAFKITKNPIIQEKLAIQRAIREQRKKDGQIVADDDDDGEQIGEIEIALEENIIEEEIDEDDHINNDGVDDRIKSNQFSPITNPVRIQRFDLYDQISSPHSFKNLISNHKNFLIQFSPSFSRSQYASNQKLHR